MSYDILIGSMEERTLELTALLAELERQIQPGVGVIVCRDNLELEYGPKMQKLLEASQADYISFMDDDDWVAPDFISRIMTALQEDPDYVGFKVKYTVDGVPQVPVIHSLQYHGWQNFPDKLTRDLVHFNPVRRSLGIQSSWTGGYAADGRWTDGLRGLVKTEVFIDEEMYYYQNSSTKSFLAPHAPVTERIPQPDFPWVTWI